MAQQFLKTSDGRCVQVRKYRGKPQLSLVDSQDPGTVVQILRREGPQVAFIFNYKGEKYVLKADKSTLELVKPKNLDSACYWFERTNAGGSEHYGLRTVAEPRQNLTTVEEEKLSLGLSNNNALRITTKNCC